ncbi:MAG TPA: ATP-binding protein [Gammaproteobacteria bacterium]|nr:ATP-binding protein [Gammaproteobacteria bacterium]
MNDGSDPAQFVISIQSAESLVSARRISKRLAVENGFTQSQATLIAAAISELARNIIQFAGRGEIRLRCDARRVLYAVASDEGPGIADVRKALEPGYSTSDGFGLGLPGVRRIADEFEISSSPRGTTVTLTMKSRPAQPATDPGQPRLAPLRERAEGNRYSAQRSRERTVASANDDHKDNADDDAAGKTRHSGDPR